MSKLSFKLLALSLGLACISNAAVTVNVIANSGSGLFQEEAGSSLQTSDLLRLGTFDEAAFDLLSASEKLDFATVDGLFTELSTYAANGSGEFFSTGQQFNVPTGNGINSGDKLYAWVFNSSTTGSATEWGIFSSTSALWTMAPDSGTTTATSSVIDNIVFGSVVAGSPNSYRLLAVPEPSAFAAIAGFLALGWVMVRRRA